MTPREREAFFTIHRDLPREGPGTPADVVWAIDQTDLSGEVDVLDAACGPGADLESLAEHLPDAALAAALDENQQEIDRWTAAPDQIAYALLIVEPA